MDAGSPIGDEPLNADQVAEQATRDLHDRFASYGREAERLINECERQIKTAERDYLAKRKDTERRITKLNGRPGELKSTKMITLAQINRAYEELGRTTDLYAQNVEDCHDEYSAQLETLYHRHVDDWGKMLDKTTRLLRRHNFSELDLDLTLDPPPIDWYQLEPLESMLRKPELIEFEDEAELAADRRGKSVARQRRQRRAPARPPIVPVVARELDSRRIAHEDPGAAARRLSGRGRRSGGLGHLMLGTRTGRGISAVLVVILCIAGYVGYRHVTGGSSFASAESAIAAPIQQACAQETANPAWVLGWTPEGANTVTDLACHDRQVMAVLALLAPRFADTPPYLVPLTQTESVNGKTVQVPANLAASAKIPSFNQSDPVQDMAVAARAVNGLDYKFQSTADMSSRYTATASPDDPYLAWGQSGAKVADRHGMGALVYDLYTALYWTTTLPPNESAAVLQYARYAAELLNHWGPQGLDTSNQYVQAILKDPQVKSLIDQAVAHTG